MTTKTDNDRTTTRRRFLAGTAASAILVPRLGWSQDAAQPQPPLPAPTSTPFSFDMLTDQMKARAAGDPVAPVEVDPIFANLSYDDYYQIEFPSTNARWQDPGVAWHLLPFHLGWLFKQPVKIFQIENGQATEMTFSTDDFAYHQQLAGKVPEHVTLPGVAGFKLTHPLNQANKFDEVISFIGASYFRALGQGNQYGASSRGLAIDSGLPKAEEFPRFSAFWLEKPAAGAADTLTLYASLDSDSVAGAYRFVISAGVDTTIDITARLFFRRDIQQLGIAPLTSMFYYSQINRHEFDDYRPQVHDSNGLRIVRADGDVIWRALDNPSQLATSYYSENNLVRFGLHQRDRDFGNYEDAYARYDLRPSIDVEPIGQWGEGVVRLFELPTDLEIHDNIGAFWIPKDPVKAGDAREFSYRLHWGMLEPSWEDDRSIVWATRTGVGGLSGTSPPPETRKFVIDFKGGMLGRMTDGTEGLTPVVNISGGKAVTTTLSKLPDSDIWRLVVDVDAEDGQMVEMNAHIAGFDRKMTEIWSFQWMKP